MRRSGQVIVASTLLALSGASSLAGHVDVSYREQRTVQVDAQLAKKVQRRTALPADNSIVRVTKSSSTTPARTANTGSKARLSIVGENSAVAKSTGKANLARAEVSKSSASMAQSRTVTRRSSIAQRATTTQGTMKVITNSSLAMAESRQITNSSAKVRENLSVTRSSTQIRDTQTVQRTSRALRAAKDDASVTRVAPKAPTERTARAKSTTTKKVASANAKRSSRA